MEFSFYPSQKRKKEKREKKEGKIDQIVDEDDANELNKLNGIPTDEQQNKDVNFIPIDDDIEIGDLPVKLELRYAIEAKRAEKGLDMPTVDDKPRRPRELTVEEEERRVVRRERNKVAASRCRVKRKYHVRKLLKESDELTKLNTDLIELISHLQTEKNKLEKAIRSHHCKEETKSTANQ